MVENSLHVRQRMVSMTEAWCKLWRWTTQGRASRSEYWFVQLWTFIITTAVEILMNLNGIGRSAHPNAFNDSDFYLPLYRIVVSFSIKYSSFA